ncbi:hypothetical protein MCOR25_003720 [Pyricularia grisea]|uniref:Feruloyl esterase C n=1 Tax=Pyricularia grisea TaxID=148305 RepID=A0A6P8BJP2_PYRGI|nr:uncharacterized protein PgNI_02057 [Pyricularia grisea]KAI6372397.1 hypothetical protein MCOR25_003720 [Pyricularia grisea]TLD16910.1 hypothetical protein PgNI_02057 [Pyricularia grisea]
MVQFSLTSVVLLASSLFSTGTFAAQSNGCGSVNATLVSGTHNISVGGLQRQYILKLPDGYDGKTPKKLIFAWHWRYSKMEDVANGVSIQPWYGLESRAKGSAIFVAPNGIDQGWSNDNGRDVNFMDAMQKELEAGLCIDTDQRFSTGFSYGGAMTFALACARASVFKAVAIIDAGQVSGCEGGNDPLNFLQFHGTEDTIFPMSQATQLKDRFIKNNGCQSKDVTLAGNSTQSAETDFTCTKKKLSFVSFVGGHVGAPLGQQSSLAPDTTWNFFTSST